MLLSILHRITGVAMAIGLWVLVLWLVSAASGPEQYQLFREAMSSFVGRALLIAWSFAFFLHLGNGVRHLVWDSGYGFEKHQANRSAWLVLASAALLTVAYWLLSS